MALCKKKKTGLIQEEVTLASQSSHQCPELGV